MKTFRMLPLMLAVLLVGFAGFYASQLAILLQRFYSPGPYADYWWVIFALRKGNGAAPLNWFWERTVDHRHVIPKILLSLDWNWFAGVGLSIVWISFALQLASVLVVGWVLRRLGASLPEQLTGMAWLALTSFHYLQHENLFLPYQVCFYLTLFFSVCAFAALALGSRVEPRGQRSVWLAAAIAASLLAGLSMGNGVFLWIPLTVVAAMLGFGPRDCAVVAGSGAAFMILYLQGFVGSDAKAPAVMFSKLWEYAIFFVTLVARPWYYLNDHAAARASQFMLVLLSAGTLWFLLRKRARRPAALFSLGMCWFLLLTLGLTAVGRLQAGFSGRYYTPALALWAYVLLFAISALPQRALLVSAQVATLALVLVGLGPTEGLRRDLIISQQRQRLATAALTSGVNDQVANYWLGAFGFIVPDNLPLLFEKNKCFRAMQPFSLVGNALEDRGVDRSCGGRWSVVRAVPNGSHPGYQAQVSGVAEDEYVLFEDQERVVGLGLYDPDRQTTTGYLRPRRSADRVQARRVTKHGDSCLIEGTYENWPDPNALPNVGDTGRWRLIWEAGDPHRVLGATGDLRGGALEMTAHAAFSQFMVDMPLALADVRTVVIRLRSEFEDLLVVPGLPGESIRGAIPFANRWMIAKLHINRRADWRQIPNRTLQLAIGAIHTKRKAISHIWVSNEDVPNTDLDVQFFNDLPQLARR